MSWNNFKAPNIGLLVYKRLYSEQCVGEKIRVHDDKLEINVPKDAKTTPFDSFYQSIYNKTLADYTQIENPFAKQKFTLLTTYPGLLLGSGYTHDSNAKGDIKIGFYFDHTTGQPVIPGSSVKGVLKSMFENDEDKTDEDSVHNIRFFINEILKDCKDDEKSEWQNLLTIITDENIELLRKLKEDIFGNQDNEGKDVFLDAVINIEKTGTDNEFLANDFITPHPDPLKNPNPLMFLKVRSNIAFEFRFNLADSKIKQANNELILTAKNKELLFQKILLTLGIGAKTNVGYGQFRELTEEEKKRLEAYNFSTKRTKETEKKHGPDKNEKNDDENIKLEVPDECLAYLKKDAQFDATIYAQKDGYNYFTFIVNNKPCYLRKKTNHNPGLKPGDKITVKFNQNFQSLENPQCKLI